jgi:outer membrane immunogenic protein
LKSDTPGQVQFPLTGSVSPTRFTVSNDFLASATARLGYSFTYGWLAYVRGGAAWTRERADNAFTTPAGIAVDPSGAMTRAGWTAGAGVEWALAPHWSTNLEYNYYDFGNNGFRLVDPATNQFMTGSLKDRIHGVTLGVNYHF